MWRFYVYEHMRPDGTVFYVGKGCFRIGRKPRYERAHAYHNRNKQWHATAGGGFAVEIIAHFSDADGAADFEKERIAERGRVNLVNLTDGGEGRRNGVFSDAERQKRSQNAKGKRSPAWIRAIRIARKNGGNGGVVKRGDNLPETWKRNIAKTKVGAKNPMFGKTGDAHPNSRFVVDAANGIRYPSITAAAKVEGLTVQVMHGMLTCQQINRTTMRLI